MNIPPNHPRAESLRIREKLIELCRSGIVTPAGLVAHGRGEAFDYLLGEETTQSALKATKVAAAVLLVAERPVISVNGNVVALVAEDIVRLSKVTRAKIEVNLFYRSLSREKAIGKVLKENGAQEVLGIGEDASATIPELGSDRRRVDPRGIYVADVVMVPLEDGDRTEALIRMGKKVVAVDLNPLSRTAQKASITIVDNIVRAAPRLVELATDLGREDREKLRKTQTSFDNQRNVDETIAQINKRLEKLARNREYISLGEGRLEL